MKIIPLFLALVAFTGAASAQTNPAPAAPVDAAKLALAREVITAMHADKMFDGLTAQMKQMSTQMTAELMPPQATPEQRGKVAALQSKVMELSMESARGLVSQMDQVYAEVYSAEELTAMKAFFLSPEGQSMLAKQPQIMQHVMPLVQQMQRDLMPKIQKLVADAKAEEAAAAAPAAPAAEPAPTPAK